MVSKARARCQLCVSEGGKGLGGAGGGGGGASFRCIWSDEIGKSV